MELAPIILFCYNRPKQTKATLDALVQNQLASQSDLYIFCDGPKNGCTRVELGQIEAVRVMARNCSGFKSVTVKESELNKGLSKSIIDGVTEIVELHGQVIVLEDDILTSEYFLQFMNDALRMYENEERVISVGACNYFAEGREVPQSFFIPIPDCWGWATWKNRWTLFEADSSQLIARLKAKGLVSAFNLFGFYDFFGMLRDQMNGKVDSWAIRWQATAYIHNKVTVYPNPSISQHQHSDQGTHAQGMDVCPQLAKNRIQLGVEKPQLAKKTFRMMLFGYYTYFSRSCYRPLFFWLKYLFRKEEIVAYLTKTNS